MLTDDLKRRRQPRSSLMSLVLFMLILSGPRAGNASDAQPPASTVGKPWQVYTEWPFSAAEAKRRQAETAKALGIPVEKTIDLGNGVTLELVLIPAGRFIMGTPKPVEPDWAALADNIFKAQIILVVAGSTVLAFIFLVIFRAWRLKQCRKVSSSFVVVFIMALSLSSWGGNDWHQGLEAQTAARSNHNASVSRFKQAQDTEQPAHNVTLSNPFYMGKYEVTQEQYEEVMGMNPSHFKSGSVPVYSVSWKDAVLFCKKQGQGIRLPSEAEWEYACRAGAAAAYGSGDSEAALSRVGWHRNNSSGKPHPVGKMESNAFGLYDMHGNVFEWCEDDWHASYKDAPGDGSAWVELPRADSRVVRGGSWHHPLVNCRSAYRIRYLPTHWHCIVGFRISLDIK